MCHTDDAIFVLGLPPNHGWRRGSRVVISQEKQWVGAQTVAVAWVVDNFETAAKINVIFQRKGQTVEGGAATLYDGSKRLRFENYYAHMESRKGDRVTLNIGKYDGVVVGDYYEARKQSEPDYPLGLVRVIRVHEMSAEASVEEEVEDFGTERHEFVLRTRTTLPSIKVAVAAVPREGAVPPSPEATKRDKREGLAGKLRARQAAPDGKLEVDEFPSTPSGDPETLLQRLADGARARKASQVVWTGGVCATEPCPSIYYADVPKDPKEPLVPKPLLVPSAMGGDAADDQSALLGQIAYAGKAYEEASYRLRAWAGSPHGGFSSEALLQLVDAEVQLGQFGRALIWLQEFGRKYDRAAKPPSYYHARVRIACSNENLWELDDLREEGRRRPDLKRAQLEASECAIEINQRRKNRATALDLLSEARVLAGELGDQDALKRLAAREAELADHPGRLDDGQKETAAEYEEVIATGEPQARANQSLRLARKGSRSGDLDGALEHLKRAVALYKETRNDAGLAECMPLLVGLWRSRDGVEQARKRLVAERRTVKGPAWRRSELGLQIGEASLDLHAGKIARARKQLVKLLSVARKSQFAEEELQILGLQVEQALIAGQMQQGQKALDQYTRRASDLRREPEQAHACLLGGRFALQEGDSKLAKEQAQRAIHGYDSLDDEAGIAAGKLLLGDVHRELGNLDASRRHYEAADRKYEWLNDEEGRRLARLGLFATEKGRADGGLRDHLQSIMTFYKRKGQPREHLRAELQFEWAAFAASRDHARTLRKLKGLRDQAKRSEFAVLRAEAQMLIACVHRDARTHPLARHEYHLARDLYAAMGRHDQLFICPELRTNRAAADDGQDAQH
ncbi:tetratricopeptide repeat protein [Nannocystis exedens]|uniref:tetratricopeptide repeat protein n=1 Tax=Nannocystis exedens TaxID=54 RepID=UPI00117D3B36|nr:hypothetical protein [Nannocystis exedens]